MNKGQSLFEVVLALGLAALILVALVSLAASSVRNVTFSKRKTVSTRYAQEATEWLRGERDAGWTTFMSDTKLYSCPSAPHRRCLEYPLSSLSWGDCGECGDPEELIDGIYRREVFFSCKAAGNPDVFKSCDPADLTVPTVNAVDATVEVSWDDGQGLHIIRSATTFSDWRARP